MSKTLKVAAVGAGYFSQFHHNAWQRMAAEGLVEFAAICDRAEHKARAVSQRIGIDRVHTDFEVMLDDVRPDLVDIVTPPPTHAGFVRAAVERGIAVICQKPFTPTLDEARRLVADIESRNGTVFVHENFRFQPWYPRLKSLLDDGAVGDVYQATFRLRPGDGQGPDAYLSRQPYFQQMPRFLVHETAIHLVDVFRYLFGDVESVWAQLDRLNPVIAGEDAGIVLFNFAGGRRGMFDGNRLADHAADNRRLTMGELCIEGSAGTLTLDGYGTIRRRPFGENRAATVDYDWNDVDYAGDCVYLTNRHVVEHLLSGAPSVNTAAEYLVNLYVEDAIYRSARQGAKIELDAISTTPAAEKAD